MSTTTPATTRPWIAPGEHGFLTGDTLYLRGGVYFENVTCAAAGEKGKIVLEW